MNNYQNIYAKPLGRLTINDLLSNLSTWRNNLRDELESLIFIRNSLNRNSSGKNFKLFKMLNLMSKIKLFLLLIN